MGASARQARVAHDRHDVGQLPRAQGRLAVHRTGQQGLGCNEERGQEECGSRSKECEGLSQERYLAPKLAQWLTHEVGWLGQSQNCEDRVDHWALVRDSGWSTFSGKVNLRQENRDCGRK